MAAMMMFEEGTPNRAAFAVLQHLDPLLLVLFNDSPRAGSAHSRPSRSRRAEKTLPAPNIVQPVEARPALAPEPPRRRIISTPSFRGVQTPVSDGLASSTSHRPSRVSQAAPRPLSFSLDDATSCPVFVFIATTATFSRDRCRTWRDALLRPRPGHAEREFALQRTPLRWHHGCIALRVDGTGTARNVRGRQG